MAGRPVCPDRQPGGMSHAVEHNVSRVMELETACRAVIARRVGLGVSALIDPIGADQAEFTLMVAEKIEAFSKAGATLMLQATGIARHTARLLTDEAAMAATTTWAMQSCGTPAAVAALQLRYSLDWLRRAVALPGMLGAIAMRAQGEVMAPLHLIATENARRLAG